MAGLRFACKYDLGQFIWELNDLIKAIMGASLSIKSKLSRFSAPLMISDSGSSSIGGDGGED